MQGRPTLHKSRAHKNDAVGATGTEETAELHTSGGRGGHCSGSNAKDKGRKKRARRERECGGRKPQRLNKQKCITRVEAQLH